MFKNDDILGKCDVVRDSKGLSFENSSVINPIKNDFENNKNDPILQDRLQNEGKSPRKCISEPAYTNNKIDRPLRSDIGDTRSNDDFHFTD